MTQIMGNSGCGKNPNGLLIVTHSAFSIPNPEF